MDIKELLKKKAQLETMNDQLMSELRYVDELMKSIGFTDGLATVKAAAEAMALMQDEIEEENESEAA